MRIDVDKLRGVERKVNRRGGITIPAALRRMMWINDGDKFSVYALDNGDIYMKRITGHCMKCGKVTVAGQNDQYICCESCQANSEGKES